MSSFDDYMDAHDEWVSDSDEVLSEDIEGGIWIAKNNVEVQIKDMSESYKRNVVAFLDRIEFELSAAAMREYLDDEFDWPDIT